jgi:hypothetical protein
MTYESDGKQSTTYLGNLTVNKTRQIRVIAGEYTKELMQNSLPIIAPDFQLYWTRVQVLFTLAYKPGPTEMKEHVAMKLQVVNEQFSCLNSV